jgi:hypothetical protein
MLLAIAFLLVAPYSLRAQSRALRAPKSSARSSIRIPLDYDSDAVRSPLFPDRARELSTPRSLRVAPTEDQTAQLAILPTPTPTAIPSPSPGPSVIPSPTASIQPILSPTASIPPLPTATPSISPSASPLPSITPPPPPSPPPLPSVPPVPRPTVSPVATVAPARVATVIFADGSTVQTWATTGRFQLIGLHANESVNIALPTSADSIGTSAAIQLLDGGTILGTTQASTINPLVSIAFRAADKPGVYRVLVRGPGPPQTLQFWVRNTQDPSAYPPVVNPRH